MSDQNQNPEATNKDPKSFFQNVIQGVTELANLRVSTVVGTFNANANLNGQDPSSKAGQESMISQMSLNEAMVSKVDMLSGDIATSMTDGFTTNKDLREYHTMRENQAHEIVIRNVKVLEKIGGLIVDFIDKDKKLKGNSTEPTNSTDNPQGS